MIAERRLNNGELYVPTPWRRKWASNRPADLQATVYRGELAVFAGPPHERSQRIRITAAGAIHLPKLLRSLLGWEQHDWIDVEWDEDDDTLVLRKAAAEGVA